MIACNLQSLSAAERQTHETLTHKLFTTATHRTTTASGYAFQLDATRVTPAEVGQWIALEQRCCPFFDFRLDLARDNGAMTLTLEGPEGARELIEAELTAT